MASNYPDIKKRFIIGLSILTVLVCVILILLVRNFQAITDLNHKLIEHPYTVSNNVRDVSIYVSKIQGALKDLVVKENKDRIDQLVTDINDYELLISKKLEIISERYLGVPEDIQAVKIAFSQWKPSRDKVINMVKEGNYDLAEKTTKELKTAQMELILTHIQTIIDFADNKSVQFNNQSILISKQSATRFIILVILSALFGVLAIYWIISSFNKPLAQIVNKIKHISKNYYKKDIHPEEKNIIAILDFAVTDLAKTSQRLSNEIEEGETLRKELQNYMDSLEDKVKERSLKLEDAKLLLEKAIDNAPIGMAMLNLKMKYLNVNQSFCDMLGYSSEELLEKNVKDTTITDDHESEIIILQKLLNNENTEANYEKRYISKAGDVIDAYITSSLVVDKDEKPVYFFKQIQDITERKKTEQELQEYKENLEKLIKERTLELESKNEELKLKNADLERYNQLFVGREYRIKELKDELNKLKKPTDK